MRNRERRNVAEREDVIQAIRDGWSVETSAEDEWSPENPAKGQCEVSSFVAWQYLGGDLVLAQVFLNGEQLEHHYWNRINGEDVDLTREQFRRQEEIVEVNVLQDAFLAENMNTMKPEVLGRINVLRERVAASLDEQPSRPAI